MMSLHSSTHSSQMNTLGPAISLRTSCWLFPQNEQYRILLLSLERPCRSSVMRSPIGISGGSGSRIAPGPRAASATGSGSPRAHAAAVGNGAAACSGGLDGVFRTALEHFVDQPVVARGLGALEVVALGVVGHGFERLAGMAGQDLVQA